MSANVVDVTPNFMISCSCCYDIVILVIVCVQGSRCVYYIVVSMQGVGAAGGHMQPSTTRQEQPLERGGKPQ